LEVNIGKVLDSIDPRTEAFIAAQPLFFVATAPLDADGHINVSPKGLDSFRVLGPHRVAYLDLTGSGNETSAHLHENGRVTFMFCAFEGRPQILRLYGRGRTVLPDSHEWRELRPLFPDYPGVRQIIEADIERIQTSCGFAVPLMQLSRQRDTLHAWARVKGDNGLERYRREKNSHSIDALPTPLGLEAERHE